MHGIMNGIIALSQAMELGRLTNEAAKTANSKELFAGLDLTGSRLWDADRGFQAIPDFDTSHEQSSLRQIRWILVIKRRERLDLFILTVALSSPVKI
jgi:hypothetical protein